MVLRCSLLGHDYGETEVDREREERGSEVVVTVREYEECSRCGDTHVISENTEVTSLAVGGDDGDAEPIDDDPSASGEEDATVGAEPAVAGGDSDLDEGVGATADPAIDDRSEAPDDALETDHPAVDDGIPRDEDGDPVTDDAEILDETDRDTDREHGEWPESDDVGPPRGVENEPAAWPDSEPETDADAGDEPDPIDEGEDAAFVDVDGDAAIVDDADAADGDAAFVDDADAADAEDAAIVDADPEAGADHPASNPAGAAVDTGIASVRSAPAPGKGAPRDGVPTEFFCPRCDFVAPGDRGSLRAGDICPECRKGYLSERER